MEEIQISMREIQNEVKFQHSLLLVFHHDDYITGAANFSSEKDNFRTVSSQGLFENIVINLYPNQSFKVLAP